MCCNCSSLKYICYLSTLFALRQQSFLFRINTFWILYFNFTFTLCHRRFLSNCAFVVIIFGISVAIYTRIYIQIRYIHTYMYVCTYICIWAHTHIQYYVSYVNWQKYGHCFRFVYLVRLHEVIYWARNYILYRAKYLQLP